MFDYRKITLYTCFLVGCETISFPSYAKDKETDDKVSKPNIIFVLTDDQGYGDLACHGNPFLHTPNIDSLYADSYRFVDFHVAECSAPTRAQLMTGMYSSRVGVWHTVKGRSLMDKSYKTIADLFEENGYSTGFFGKWHLGDNYPYRPQDRGFQEVIRLGGGGIGNIPDYFGNTYFDDHYEHNGVWEQYEGYCTDVFFSEALKFIKKNIDEKQPFFAYIPTNAPHLPYVVAEEYRKMYPEIESGLQEFYGMITNIDDNIGRLRTCLKKWEAENNTILIFMTDNGSARGFLAYNAGMRGGKGTPYDGGHRVPFFIHYPAEKIQGGVDIDELVGGIDLLPTLIELCGLETVSCYNYDGKSLMPLIRGEAWEERTLIVDNQRTSYPEKHRKTAVMTNEWRLVNGNELYAIDADPSQSNNVINSHPEVARQLMTAYENWWEDVYGSTKFSYPISIGADRENPTLLTAHDLHGACAWNHDQVLAASPIGGYWELYVEEDGLYEITLRRYPREFNYGINSTPLVPSDMKYLQYTQEKYTYAVSHSRAAAINASGAHLYIAGQSLDMIIPEKANVSDARYELGQDGHTAGVRFLVNLKKGETRMQANFVNVADDGDIYGVYYVYVKEL